MFMIDKIIDEINAALSHNLYFAALSLVLTLPDICGRAEYPSYSVTARYISWYNRYIGQYDCCPCDACKDAQMPHLSGEVVYNLRNSFLHQGTPNINSSKINDATNKIDDFILVVEKENEFNIYSDASSVVSLEAGESLHKSYRVSIRRLCLIITLSAKNFYDKNRDKFNFFNYCIFDFNKHTNSVSKEDCKLMLEEISKDISIEKRS